MSIANKIQLNSFDSLFGTDNKKDIVNVPIEKLHTFGSCYKSWQRELNHPFKVVDDEKMADMVESIKEYGVLTPIIVRAKDDEYEIISGHRRTHACETIGLKTIPAIVKELTDDEAVILMVDSNIQRDEILPSEKAFSYKMKLEALKHQGKTTSSQIGTKLRADEQLAQEAGESRNTIQRYIRLTHLHKELLEYVDGKQMPVNVGVELSYLPENEQEIVYCTIDDLGIMPTIAHAKKFREYSEKGKFNAGVVDVIMTETKEKPVSLKIGKEIQSLFPKDYSKKDMEQLVSELLKEYFEKG